jgi:methyltransferase (TIGR00027 family)
MTVASSSVRNISDTARWVAYFRALETDRPDALFRDPYAKRLAGERGFEIAHTLPDGNKHEWAWTARTYLFDEFLSREIREGADVVLNLAAGLDARPYRMDLPNKLRWIEVDLPEIIAYKEEVLSHDKPRCILERVSLDLADGDARLALFERINHEATRVVVITEGLLIYLTDEQVAGLARDLAALPQFHAWLIDLASPGQLKLMQQTTGKQLSSVGAPFKFGPPEGANFFMPYGWKPREIEGMLATAAKFNRVPPELLNLYKVNALPGSYLWTGVCLLHKAETHA